MGGADVGSEYKPVASHVAETGQAVKDSGKSCSATSGEQSPDVFEQQGPGWSGHTANSVLDVVP